jgi:hypothetical protein
MVKVSYVRAVILSLFLMPSVFAAQKEQETVPPAPIPEQILSGRTAFISYAGINSHFIESYIADHTGRPNGLYDEFYAAIKSWGKYSLVSSPADADLVFEISLIREAPSVEDPDLELKILDPKTQVILWTFLERVPAGSGREPSRRKAWDNALTRLIDGVKGIAAPAQ